MQSDFRADLQIIGHDLHRPAVTMELVNNCASVTESLAHVGGEVPEHRVGSCHEAATLFNRALEPTA